MPSKSSGNHYKIENSRNQNTVSRMKTDEQPISIQN